ncbi:energy transducer TonB [Endozoicomonas sp. SM1973]|uniref:Energy transducer TonB n=1 Tax=Spartinivicinus marinus TaxID=2994442 RepID=A0A853IAQ5_9GAMM|nr:energy transducer TonB [Spartinivicinus marinus]MCX4026672.1 energy transducer TonB [Spartinivicinus marinus]NYZ64506.1 energy transducer TonB [Spartinivicinus marinus]
MAIAEAYAHNSSTDRLLFATFVAIGAHLLLLLISFDLLDPPKMSKAIEITLASYESQKRPDKADFLAQADQEGSGTLEEKARPTTNQQAQIADTKHRKISPQPQEQVVKQQEAQKSDVVTTTSRSKQRVTADTKQQKKQKTNRREKTKQFIEISAEVAAVQAQLDQQVQEYAKRPKIHRITAASTMRDKGAFYKEAWRRKVEKVGNINYPEKARQSKIYGSLRLVAIINADGSLDRVEISSSSGKKVLDDAAIRIVKLAAPYAPFGDDLREFDKVEIIRTFRFEKGNYLSSF